MNGRFVLALKSPQCGWVRRGVVVCRFDILGLFPGLTERINAHQQCLGDVKQDSRDCFRRVRGKNYRRELSQLRRVPVTEKQI